MSICSTSSMSRPTSSRKRRGSAKWRAIAGMRDRLIHSYFGVDYEIVWDVVITKIPTLAQQVQRLLDEDQR